MIASIFGAAPLPTPSADPVARPSDRSRPSLPVATLVLVAALAGVAVAVAGSAALFICISLLACIFVALDFRVGTTLLVVLMPISASSLFPHGIAGLTGLNPLNLLLLGTLAAWLARGSDRVAGRFAPRPLVWLYVVPIAGAALLGAGHTGEIPALFGALGLIGFDSATGYLRDMLLKPLFMVLFALLVGQAMARTRRLDGFLTPMLLSVWLMGLTTVAFVYLSGASLGELASSRSRGFFSPLGMHANDLGRCYAMAYALMLYTFAASDNFRLRLALIASMGMVVVALLMTFSRGAFLGFVVVNALFLLSRRRILPLLAATLLMAGLLALLPGAVFERIGAGWEGGLNAISAGRVDDIWLPLLPAIGDSPLVGHGLGSILWSDAMHAGTILQVTHPHNAYLQALLDMGLLGLILVGSYFIHVWRGFRRLGRNPALDRTSRGFYQGAAAGLLAFLITAFAGSSLLPVPEQSFLWLAIGMMYGRQAAEKVERHA